MATNIVNLPGTSHSYTNGTNQAQGHDENYSTSHTWNQNGWIVNQHIFSTGYNISQVKYKLAAHWEAYGDDWADGSSGWKVEYTYDGSNWITLASG